MTSVRQSSYAAAMSSRPLTFRPTPEVREALTELATDGLTTTDAINQAIVEAARWRQQRRVIRAEVDAWVEEHGPLDSDDLAWARRVLSSNDEGSAV